MAVSQIDNNGVNLGQLGNRNLIINSAMQVAQRGTSAAITSGGYAALDRYRYELGGGATGRATISQSSDAPTGFGSSYKVEVTTADATPSTGYEYSFKQSFEGQNLQSLKKGTADAESVTVSFWVKSSVTGTFIVELMDNDNSNRHINKSYTISLANTWEYKTITFAGDTTGALDNDNGNSLHLQFWHGAGSQFTSGSLQTTWGALAQANRAVGQTNLYATLSNTWQITGVQLEVGDTATPFEHRSYGDELALCSRYTHVLKPEQAYGRYRATYNDTGLACNTFYEFPVEMRSVPTLINNNMSSSTFQCYSETDGGFRNPTGAFTLAEGSKRHAWMSCLTATATAGAVGLWRWNNYPSASMVFDAEL